MGNPTGFTEYAREEPRRRPVAERIKDYREVVTAFEAAQTRTQAARCMDCGIPFCQAGCPLGNSIPDWNDLVYRDQWKAAYHRLARTNNFPEFTGRICPAPCESACVLGLVDDPVTIEQIEREIIERAFQEGWVTPRLPQARTGTSVAVIGSGPAGLACADQLNQAGHVVTVFERDDHVGGLLRYGIPDFKLDKRVVQRRVDLMAAEGITFRTGVEVGRTLPVEELESFDAIVLCTGSTRPRDLPIPGRDLGGIHFAWDYLTQQNRRVAGLPDVPVSERIDAAGKHVIVIGGGDTGSDCIGTAHRQGAASVTQFELMPMPPGERPDDQPWPYMPMVLKETTSHEEGGARHWQIMTQTFEGREGRVAALRTVIVEPVTDGQGRRSFRERPGTERSWAADLVLLAIGYVGPEQGPLLRDLGVALSDRGTVACPEPYQTAVPGVFAAGDARRGQSLVVWAIHEGREAAHAVDQFLMGFSALPVLNAAELRPHA